MYSTNRLLLAAEEVPILTSLTRHTVITVPSDTDDRSLDKRRSDVSTASLDYLLGEDNIQPQISPMTTEASDRDQLLSLSSPLHGRS